MVVIAVPLGGILAFVMERTDLPGKRWIEPLILVPELRVADGPGLRLRRRRRARRLLYGLGDRIVRRRAVGHLFPDGDRHHRRPAARAQRLRLRVGGAEEPRLGRRGSRARRRRVAVSRRHDGEPAADHAGDAVRGGPGVLPGLRAVRPAAGAGRPGRPPRAVDVPVQADQQARHAVVSPDGRGRDLHRRGDVSAGAAAALPAAERAQVRDDQGQGRPDARTAARQVEVGRRRR